MCKYKYVLKSDDKIVSYSDISDKLKKKMKVAFIIELYENSIRICDSIVCGELKYDENFDEEFIMTIDQIFTNHAYRGKGFADEMIKYIIEVALDCDIKKICGEASWIHCKEDDYIVNLHNYYKKRGFQFDTHTSNFHIMLD